MNKIRKITVGILSGKEIEFSFSGDFLCSNGLVYNKSQKVIFKNGKIFFDNNFHENLTFLPESDNDFFELKNVVIGKQFHWQQSENQRFCETLTFIIENDSLTAINEIDVESYLKSVISSEMSANASDELLKAHAVISRSWLLANLITDDELQTAKTDTPRLSPLASRFVTWYERDAHTNFDVCADDHCQRYQGITRQTNERVNKAVEATQGMVLTCGGEICDARFSKSCGGVTEIFENCWADTHFTYLESVIDSEQPTDFSLDLTKNGDAEKFICSQPECFCNTREPKILSQVLNNYDQQTTDIFRWQCEFSQKEIAEIIAKKSGVDFGAIMDLVPLKRGASGRIVELQVVGTKQVAIVGKELEIRKWLSQTHLYSSAFVVEKSDFSTDIPQRFLLRGAGWGHGVGLCQIGAAVMGEKGYNFKEILAHYYKNTEISSR
ncbi:MAG: SpoIID/LytB domain-containing protein [Prevotellaceae bacterium]|jgi:SpoIID/LytB domain protein|nr:SpoIID/LytB domain-containing protein [Prevotellaceae bacterium]